MFEYNLCGKWLELLKEIAPNVTHAAILRNADTGIGIGQFAVIQAMAPLVGIEVRSINLREPAQIERDIATFAQRPNGGMIQVASATGPANFNLIVTAAARYKLPTVYIQRPFVAAGGLISYGPDFEDQFRRAASTSIASSKARDRPTCRCRPRTSTNSPSTSRPPRRWAWPCRCSSGSSPTM
jgi:putative tryptophan/tyrosine transport system substrate-binding protein